MTVVVNENRFKYGCRQLVKTLFALTQLTLQKKTFGLSRLESSQPAPQTGDFFRQ